jgi:hypothetical protein
MAKMSSNKSGMSGSKGLSKNVGAPKPMSGAGADKKFAKSPAEFVVQDSTGGQSAGSSRSGYSADPTKAGFHFLGKGDAAAPQKVTMEVDKSDKE